MLLSHQVQNLTQCKTQIKSFCQSIKTFLRKKLFQISYHSHMVKISTELAEKVSRVKASVYLILPMLWNNNVPITKFNVYLKIN